MDYQYTYNCGLLRLFDQFDAGLDARVPRFEYRHNDEGLVTLREKYGLEAEAGQGDDWSKVLNLMRWLHGNTYHNGNICEPIPCNSLDLLDYSFRKGEEPGINCRMLATILAESCLAIGLKARIVSIYPLNPYDFDNHVVTIVWCRSFGKWVMVDPSFSAYLTGSEGTVLSPWEVRDLLCRNRVMTCCDELDYNGVKHEPKGYLSYIAKDLVYMLSPVCSGFGCETLTGQRWVILAPQGFDVLKREAYNMEWRDRGENGRWNAEELKAVIQGRMTASTTHIYTSSIASFAQPPATQY